MLKWITVIFSLLLAIASFYAYFYVNAKIIDGERQLSAGQARYNQGQQQLQSGKARLRKGERELSSAKQTYHGVHTVAAISGVAEVPVLNSVFHTAKRKIASGDQQVAAGKQKVKAGEAALAAGREQLAAGRAKLALAKQMRLGLLISTLFFSILTLWLLVGWRRSLFGLKRA